MSINRYEPRSHFFVDHNNLKPTNPSNEAVDAFGPVIGNETNQYRTTSFVRASETSKVFAICDGEIMIQPQTEDTTKVNLILKPAASAPYAPVKIKYFIYRGVNKSDLINNNILVDVNESDPDQPIFLQKLWKEFIDFNMPFYEQGLLDTPPETFPALLIGYNENQDGETLIEHYFKRNNDGGNIIFYQIPTCKEGEFLGNFTGRIGLDVVLDYGDYELTNQDELFKLDLNFARKAEHIFDIGDIPYSTSIKEKRYKEYIHQFMDAAAFWGSHIECGKIRTISTPNGITSSNDIFTNILNKYQTKNKLYFYIQAERGRSYNYYDDKRKVYGIDSAGIKNETNGWPILIKEKSFSSIHTMTIEFDVIIDTNIDPFERRVSIDVFAPDNKIDSIYPTIAGKFEETLGNVGYEFKYDVSKLFTDPTIIGYSVESNNPLPEGLGLQANSGIIEGIPTTVGTSISAIRASIPGNKYYRKELNFIINPKISLVPLEFQVNASKSCASFIFLFTKLSQEFPIKDYFNELWTVNLGSSLTLPTGTNDFIHWLTYDRNRLVDLDDTLGCSAIIQNKVVFDTGFNEDVVIPGLPTKKRRLYIASIKSNTTHNFENDNLNVNYSSAGLEKLINNNEKYIDEIFNDKSFSFYRGKFTDGSTINSLCLIHDTNFNRKNSYFMLGITEEEYNILIYDNPTIPNPPTQILPRDAENTFFHLEEDTNFTHENIRKFKVGLWFEDNEGNISDPLYPSTDVIVYTMDGFTFFSKEFSDYQEFYSEFANALVEFRTVSNINVNPPIPVYNGEFGFDWLRVDDSPMDTRPTYYDSILGGYKRPHGTDLNTEFQYGSGTPPNTTVFNDAFKALKREYKSIPTQKTNEQYFAPYLSLFSETFSNSDPTYIPILPFEASLRVYVEIREDLDKLEFEYDKTLLKLDKDVLNDKFITNDENGNIVKQESIDKTITITCLKDFSEQKTIRVFAYPLGNTDRNKAKLAGMIILNKNDVFTRRVADIVLVKVQTNADNNPITPLEKGVFTNDEKNNLANVLYQSLILPNIKEESSYLPLENNNDFKIGGKYIESTGDGSYYIKHREPGLQAFLRSHFLTLKPNFSNYFTIFSFGLETKLNSQGGRAVGNVQGIGVQNVNLFDGRGEMTLSHEALHGYGLYHTHREEYANSSNLISITEPEKKYVFPNANNLAGTNKAKATDNYMSYNGNNRKTLWDWQVSIILKNLK